MKTAAEPSPAFVLAQPPARRLHRRARTVIITALLLALLLAVYVGGALLDAEAGAADFQSKTLPPSLTHPFGTDFLGRDMLARTWQGLSLSIVVGTVASVVSALLALLVGVAAASGGGLLDHFLNWLIDLVMSIPHTVLLILIAFACGRGLTGVLIGIAATHWTGLARIIRAEVLQLRDRPYILAARKLGRSRWWIFRRHLLPHLLPQFLIGLILLFPHAILHEAALTFLGFGLPPEQPAIGIILAEAMRYLSSGFWWQAFFPGLSLLVVVLLFDRLGESLKLLLDPWQAEE